MKRGYNLDNLRRETIRRHPYIWDLLLEMWFVGNCFLSNFLKMIFLTAVLLFQLHHGLCSPLLMRPTFVAYWRCLATATTRYPVWCRFFSLQKVKYLFPDYGIQNLTRRKWGRRAYLVNARTAELHLQQTGSSLEYKWGEWLMIMTVMQDGEGKPFEDPPGPAPQTAALAFPGDWSKTSS